jgi:hypothetical protein
LIRADYAPETLVEHLASVVDRALVGGAPACPVSSETHWQAGRYRFADVPLALHHWSGPRDRPHPLTEVWRDRGLTLVGTTIDEQLLSYANRPSSRLPASEFLWGDGCLEVAIGQLSGAGETTRRLIGAAAFLRVPDDWHHHVFQLAATADELLEPGGLRG